MSKDKDQNSPQEKRKTIPKKLICFKCGEKVEQDASECHKCGATGDASPLWLLKIAFGFILGFVLWLVFWR